MAFRKRVDSPSTELLCLSLAAANRKNPLKFGQISAKLARLGVSYRNLSERVFGQRQEAQSKCSESLPALLGDDAKTLELVNLFDAGLRERTAD